MGIVTAQTLVGHCELWINKFTGLLNSIAQRELAALHTYFATGTASLKRGPATLEQLAMQLTLQKQLVSERAATEARFRPLREQYQVLEKFEVSPFSQPSVCSRLRQAADGSNIFW